jgi:hypothetical protein
VFGRGAFNSTEPAMEIVEKSLFDFFGGEADSNIARSIHKS